MLLPCNTVGDFFLCSWQKLSSYYNIFTLGKILDSPAEIFLTGAILIAYCCIKEINALL